MKVLCLHGVGQNASIMEALTSSIRYYLPRTWNYTFIDGEKEFDAAPGIAEIFSGPYLCYHSDFTIKDIDEQVEMLHEIIEDEGPFEGFIGFSQGAALGATMLVHHERDHPFAEPPFRFAVFLGGTLPFSRDVDAGHDVSMDFSDMDVKKYVLDRRLPKALEEKRRPGIKAHDPQVTQDENLQPSRICRLFWSSPNQLPVQVPSVHVYGAKDEWLEHSLELAALFEPRDRSEVQHEGGHQIPTSPDVIQEICKMIEAAATKSELRQ